MSSGSGCHENGDEERAMAAQPIMRLEGDEALRGTIGPEDRV